MAAKVRSHIRWMIRRDLPEVYEIENECSEFPWSEDDFIRCLRQRNCIGMVAEHNDQVTGFMIYELHKSRLHILNFAVHPVWQRRGVGTALVDKLVYKLSMQKRNNLMLEIRETNVASQCFFRAMGFKAISVLRGFYQETDEDAYVFEFRLQEAQVPK